MTARESSTGARSRVSGLFALAAGCAAAAAVGCAGGDADAGGATARESSSPMVGAVESTETVGPLGFESPEDFLTGYWSLPIPLQGAPPPEYSALEASLRPADCGSCHPTQYADWRTTVHARAYSPGLAGQLVEWEERRYETVRACLTCHAPLSEQSAMLPGRTGELVRNASYERELRDRGLVCAACHVRRWRRYGPPKRDGSPDSSPRPAAHGGVTRTPFFEDSRFCYGCHQFEGSGPNGKPLQNTFREWQNSRFAAEGVSCQGCHMPERRHLWRGIHDSDMVRSGVTIEWIEPPAEPPGQVGLRITNTGTGHHFPTYVTCEIVVRLQLLDANRVPVEGGTHERTIARRVEKRGADWIERFDTRLPPDSSLSLVVPSGEARFARASVVVRPDAHYSGEFERLLAIGRSDTSAALLRQAYGEASTSTFTIFEETVPVER